DTLIYEEKDGEFWLQLSRSRDGKYLFHTSTSYTATEQRFLSATAPAGEWKVFLPREPNPEYTARHPAGRFYIPTNPAGATNFKVVTCPVAKTDPANWVDLLPYDPTVLVSDVAVFRDHAVLSERADGLPRLRVVDLRTGKAHRVEFPEPIHEVSLGTTPEF